ncbi:MAG TPA: sugar phosphate isomerase/epimerase family protein [Pirellulales bacterium]|jgi:sugar phosphate isomerase/epimerase|nr:sugar phosphate isomerase/epimerase family protein [Pirellulales bacterium]
MDMQNSMTRRTWFCSASGGTAGLLLSGLAADRCMAAPEKKPLYKISCTEYSLHRMLAKGALNNLDFAPFVRTEFSLRAVEYWNRPFNDKAEDKTYLAEMRKRADDAGVEATVILVDGAGHLGDPDAKLRNEAVDRHKKWVHCAAQLGCHSIRVNAHSKGSYDEQLRLAAEGLTKLSDYAAPVGINVLVENHGGFSSDGGWLASVMQRVNKMNCGTLPDFGNFGAYNRYLGVKQLMPYAKCVSAKSNHFDAAGNETGTDYLRMMKIVVAADYHGYVGIEYEGDKLTEVEGVKATQRLLERVRRSLATAS